MKKNLFYLFALICSMSLFTACSDDDDKDTGWMEYQEPTEFSSESNNATLVINGANTDVQARYPLKFVATSATQGKLTLGYTPGISLELNYEMDVTLSKDGTGYKFAGEKEVKDGYVVTVTGRVGDGKISVTVESSGYASVSGTYSGNKLVLTYNGAALVANPLSGGASVSFKSTSEKEGVASLIGIIPGVYNAEADSQSGLAVPVTMTLDNDVYTFSGELNNDKVYTASTVKIEGKIENGVMTAEVTHQMTSDVVGKWNVKMSNPMMAEVVFDFATATGKTTFSDALMELVKNGNPQMAGMIKQEMSDAELTVLIKTLLGMYVPNLNSIEFTATGDVIITYTPMEEGAESATIAGMLNYIIKDGKVSLVPNLGALMGMMSNTKAYNPAGILSGDGIPFNYAVNGSDLTLSLSQDVPMGLLPLVQGLVLPMLPSMGVDQGTADMITVIINEVSTILAQTTNFNVGLVLTK